MKTIKQVIAENKEFSKLIKAVIKQLGGTDYISDINSHGINSGFQGFTYYSDTHEFAIKNRKQIVELLERLANDLGNDVIGMVLSFRCVDSDKENKRDLYKYLVGSKVEQGSITNVMSWFAAEEVCRMFED